MQTFANSPRATQQGVPTLTFPLAPTHTCEKCIRARGWRKDDTKIINVLIKTQKKVKSVCPEPNLFSPVAFWPGTFDERIRTPRNREKNVAMSSKTALCAESVTVVCQEKFVCRASLPPSAPASAQFSALRWVLLFRLSWWTQPPHSPSPLCGLSTHFLLPRVDATLSSTRSEGERERGWGEEGRGHTGENAWRHQPGMFKSEVLISFWIPTAAFVYLFIYLLILLPLPGKEIVPAVVCFSVCLFVCLIVS